MGERGPGRQLDLRDPHTAADLCGAVCLKHFRLETVAGGPRLRGDEGSLAEQGQHCHYRVGWIGPLATPFDRVQGPRPQPDHSYTVEACSHVILDVTGFAPGGRDAPQRAVKRS